MLTKYYIVSPSVHRGFYQYSVNVSLCSELKYFDKQIACCENSLPVDSPAAFNLHSTSLIKSSNILGHLVRMLHVVSCKCCVSLFYLSSFHDISRLEKEHELFYFFLYLFPLKFCTLLDIMYKWKLLLIYWYIPSHCVTSYWYKVFQYTNI